jgi:hypothetical protein
MKLSDIYDQLAYSELRHIVMGSGAIDAVDQGMTQDSFQKLLPLVQLGLTELHKKFLLREKELYVELQPGQLSYSLSMDVAQANPAAAALVKYLDDTLDPFEDDLMRVEKIYGTLNSERYVIPYNVRDNEKAIRSPRHGFLIMPDDPEKALWLKETTKLRVIYRADHPKIEASAANKPLVTEVFLPPTFLQALVYYVASRVLNAQGASAEFHEGNNYTAKYEQEVLTLKAENYTTDADIEHDKLGMRGFA